MESEIISRVAIKDTYETQAGKKKTETITVRSMVNQGSMFCNIHYGQGSVNIPKDKVGKVAKALTSLEWKETDKDSRIKELEKQLKALKK